MAENGKVVKETHFMLGFLIGTVLSALVIGFFSIHRIKDTSHFGDSTMRILFAALDDIEALQEKCGVLCEEVTLSYRAINAEEGFIKRKE